MSIELATLGKFRGPKKLAVTGGGGSTEYREVRKPMVRITRVRIDKCLDKEVIVTSVEEEDNYEIEY
jgi:hypothetical protein